MNCVKNVIQLSRGGKGGSGRGVKWEKTDELKKRQFKDIGDTKDQFK